MKKTKKFAAVGGALALMTLLAGCTQHFTDPSMVSVRYSGGVSEGGAFVECVEPGVKQVSNDTYYNYPTTQREDVWDSARFNAGDVAGSSADQASLRVTDKTGNAVDLKLKAVFRLETECKTLQEFHEKIGRTREAWFDEESKYGAGWLWVMNNYISSAVEQQASNFAVDYTVEELWLKPDVREALSKDIEKTIQKAVNDLTEGETQFFEIGDVAILAAEPDKEFQKLYQDRKNSQVKAETAEANKSAQLIEAQAKAEVAREQAKAREAEIAGYGGPDAYLRWLAINEGMNPYQPSYGTAPTPTVSAE
jgi:hypothetical protein